MKIQVGRKSSLTAEVVSKASCAAVKLCTPLSHNRSFDASAQLETVLVVTTSAAPVEMLELLQSAIVIAKKKAALTRTTQAPGKLTVQRFTGGPSLAGAAAVFCLSVATCSLIFCLVSACFAAA